MSEPVLKAIIQLFALVAKEDGIAVQERNHIKSFLLDRLSQQAASEKLALFDRYTQLLSKSTMPKQELQTITSICDAINAEIVQKQKIVVMAELMSIILADGIISPQENKLAQHIGSALHIQEKDSALIQLFLSGKTPDQLDCESILIIDGRTPTNQRYKHIFREDIDGFIAFLYIHSAKMCFFKYIGQTEVFLNGIPKRQNHASVIATGSTLRWDNATPVYHRDILAQFKELETGQKLSFEAKNLSYTFKNGNVGLKKINIAEESGSLTAIMGASGSGKSTLLYVLNGMLTPTAGQVLINGIDIHKEPDKIEGIIGFVPQDDMLIEDLTVYQNIHFAAQFCFGHLSQKELEKLTVRTLESIGLWGIRDLKVGAELKRTISGGERKRLNIGLELLREPAILFCDEPTSGLSSRDSENILVLLKELALKGKLIFTVIHQPSSSIFKMFDTLIILDTGGHQIYYGNPVDAVMYFKDSINSINSKQGECITCGSVNPEQIFSIIETKVINEYGNFSNERRFSPKDWSKRYVESRQLKKITHAAEKPHTLLSIPGKLKQVWLFLARDVLAKASNTQYILINLLEAPLLAFILSSIVKFYNPDNSFHTDYVFGDNINIPSYFFMSVIVALFMGLTVSAEEIIRDRKILKRESFLQLSWGSYLVSKISVLFIISAIQTLSFVLIGNYILAIKGMGFTYWIILFSSSCVANVLGLNISSAFNSAVTIYILIPILLIPQLILSGAVVKFDKLNPLVGNTEKVPFIGNLMASRWAFEAAMVMQFKNNDFEKKFYPIDQRIAAAGYKKNDYIPYLESVLGRVDQYHRDGNPEIDKKDIETDFALLRNEIDKELGSVEYADVAFMDKLHLQRYDTGVHVNVVEFFDSLKQHYAHQYYGADKEKKDIIRSMTKTPEDEKEFAQLRASHQNKAVAALVKNSNDPQHIIRKQERLTQKIFPIYKKPTPDHLIDFSTQFYVAEKRFMKRNVSTPTFNMGMIWAMSFLLFITLYFKVLQKIVDGLASFSSLIPKRM